MESADAFIHLTPEQKQWVLAASRNDMYSIERLFDSDSKAGQAGIASTRDPWNGYTALHWAAKHGNQKLVGFLVLEAGMNPNVRSRGGYTPLILAGTCNRVDVCKYLVDKCGADLDIRDYSGRKASHYLDDFRRAADGEDTPNEFEYAFEGGQGGGTILGSSQTLPNLRRKAAERSASFLRELAAVRGSMRQMRHHKHFKSSLDTVEEVA